MFKDTWSSNVSGVMASLGNFYHTPSTYHPEAASFEATKLSIITYLRRRSCGQISISNNTSIPGHNLYLVALVALLSAANQPW